MRTRILLPRAGKPPAPRGPPEHSASSRRKGVIQNPPPERKRDEVADWGAGEKTGWKGENASLFDVR